MTVNIGAAATQSFTVDERDTAIAMGSGDVPVLGTPRMIAWCEQVTVVALASELAPNETSVGTGIRIDHLAPTPVGAEVTVSATVSEVDGRQVTLAVTVEDPSGAVGKGTIARVVVDRERFISRATASSD